MKKLLLLAFTAILATSFACAQGGWINYKIDSKLSVKLPSEPTALDASNKMARDKDGLGYIIAVIDFVKVAGLDSVKLRPMAPTQEFAESIKTGMAGQMPGFTMGDVKISKWKGHYCYTVDGGNESKKLKFYTFMVLIGNNIYGLSALVPYDKSAKGKDYYFDSLVLN